MTSGILTVFCKELEESCKTLEILNVLRSMRNFTSLANVAPQRGNSLWQVAMVCGLFLFALNPLAEAQVPPDDCVPGLMIFCPDDVSIDCSEPTDPEVTGSAEATVDPCFTEEVAISYADEVLTQNDCEVVLARTWLASAGNETDMCTQTITIVDETAPALNMPPLYYSLEWSVFDGNFLEAFQNGEISLEDLAELSPLFNDQLEAQGFFFPTASDNCDLQVQPYYTQFVQGPEDLECPLVGEVIWDFYAQDDCGNETGPLSIVCEFFDTTPPEFINFPEDSTVECVEDIPAPVEVEAEDACADVVEIEVFTSETGAPETECVATTAFAPGDDWALWLPTLEVLGLTATDDFVPMGEGLTFIQYADGTAHLSGMVQNDEAPGQQWEVSIWLENKRDWDEWSGLGRSYKDSFGFAEAGGNLWETWHFYEMVNNFSMLTGAGDLEGNVLYLEHMPSNFYHGFQCGEAANDRNANFGMSGWFTFYGQFEGEFIEGHGDVNVDKECEDVTNPDDCPDTAITYFYRAEDTCGNVAMDEYTVTSDDTTAPEFTVVPEDITVECDAIPEVFEGVEATDNCACGVELIEYLGEIPVDGGTGCEYQIQRIWAAEDCCENRAEYIQTITVVDTTAPIVLTTPENITVECDEVIPEDLPTAEDNCQPEVFISFEDQITEGDCPQNYTIIRTFFLDDGCGNISQATQTIQVVDTTPPVFDEYEVEVAVECTEVDNVPQPTATDNCGQVSITSEDVLQSGGCLGVIVRTFTAVDECGNESTTEQFITVQDTTPPVIENPNDMTVECDEVPEAPGADGINIFDNCELFAEEEVTVEFTETITEGFCQDNYTITWTWIATDYCENVSEATTIITVQDTTDPVFTQVPDDLTIECDQEVPGCDVNSVVAVDNCDEDVVIECSDQMVEGDCPEEYTIQRIYRAFDNCGNQGVYVQNISVVDTTAPVVDPVADLTIECDQEIPTAEATATDNCSDFEVNVEESQLPGDCPQEFTIIRVYTATDACGNVSDPVEQTIQVVDTTAPVFEDYPIEVDVPCDDLDSVQIMAEDNCGAAEVTYTDLFISGGCAGTIIRDYIATDECGNTAEAQQILHLFDEEAPVFTNFPDDQTVECDAVPEVTEELTAEDNCDDDAEVVYNGEEIIEGDCPQSYTIVRTWTATDDCDNDAVYTQNITVVDTTAPEFEIFPEDATVECDMIPEVATGATAFDNCDEDVAIEYLGEEIIAGECEDSYTIVRTWVATDDCGNATEQSQTITVIDTTAPEFEIFPEDATVECDMIPEVATGAEATDNCDADVAIEYLGEEIIEGQCEDSYTIIRTWVATDNCGNATEQSQTITVIDTTAPEFTIFPEDATVECDMVPEVATGAEAVDNCDDDVSIEYLGEELIAGECEDSYTLVRTWVATDNCGNATEQSQTITVQDTTAPEFTVFPADETVECDMIPEVATGAEATDNCDDEVVIEYIGEEIIAGDVCPQSYTIVRTWTATDNCGNVTEQSQTITVQDTTAPEFEIFPEDATVECDMIPEVATGATAFDNCDEDVTIEYLGEEIVDGECPQSYTIIRTWVATDDCGNATEQSQTITVQDTTAPVFDMVGEDVTVECDQELPAPMASATDNCGEVSITNVDVIEEGECAQEYTVIRTYTATDECGNSTTEEQIITVVDTTAPVLEGTPEAELVIDCEDDVPAADEVFATDACEGEVDVVFTEELVGDLPPEGSSAFCNAMTPEAFEDGETCAGTETWSVVLFNFAGEAASYYSTIDASWTEFPDGSAVLTGSVSANNNPDAGWEIAVEFENGMDWATWSTQGFPTDFKDDCDLAGDSYLNWMYYIMSEGATLTGWGDYAGSVLTLEHAPSNLYYGFQLGDAANNVNANYSFGGWFTYEGIYNGEEVSGAGDFAFDLDCCPQYEIVRTWCATDCAGNETCFTQVISFADLGGDAPIVGPDAHEMIDPKIDFQIVKVNPNPSNSFTNVQFASNVNATVRLDLLDLNGRTVNVLFEGNIQKNEIYRTLLNASEFEAGMYFLRLQSAGYADIERFVISR